MATAKKTAAKTAAKPRRVKKSSEAETERNAEALAARLNDPKVIAKVNAYNTLKDAGAPISDDLAVEVEALIEAVLKLEEERANKAQKLQEARKDAIEEANKTGPVYIRNGYPSKQSIRLERQEGEHKKIQLEPRGRRGDLFPLQEGDIEDPAIRDGIRKGLIELVGSGDAQDIISKQTENLQTQHVPLTTILNEQGKPYSADSVRIEAEFGRQGVVVAIPDPNIGKQQENINWKGSATTKDGGLIRAESRPERVERFIPTGGNQAIISSGFETTTNEAAMRMDEAARGRGEGPDSVLPGVRLTVEAPKKAGR